ncbi:type I pullulanase [Pontibacter diazotrophicus]|uniref:Type I pullulanase n=1 Tax=Pontibacter diazotrophicus TaxID=1400979 RepID=A0A3D8LH92_9BACT|nr:type I pullulanase [Pontibacter diazotrophicus]RDV16728.1 type I pullulanase [Pontibacter diazotrophicus]
MTLFSTKANVSYRSFSDYPTYAEENLWTHYTPKKTTFKLWSPVAEEVVVHLYTTGDGGEHLGKVELEEVDEGLWVVDVREDLLGTYYTFQVKVKGKWLNETPGIYATAVGVNGKRAMVLDLAATDPENWENDKGPDVASPNEVVLYETHVRDFTISGNSGSSKPGKFLGLVEQGTTNPEGLPTGIDHMKELGITHVHLLPAFDYMSVDESAPDKPQYNWGYDPQNYNVPEGSYSSDPYRAEVRIREFKEMVQDFHSNGLGVILDVVYNHTGLTEGANFNLEVPGYYYRHAEGTWSNASGCGNETASERTMMRKFIIESCRHWAQEYHIDGFRFDLMAIHDIETMNLLTAELKKINPNIIVYGEGWTAGGSPLPYTQRASKSHTYMLKQVSAFSDDMRDALKGSVFDARSRGFISGAHGMEESIKFGVIGSIQHPEVHSGRAAWAREPWQSVSYVSCHDNQTLYDKLKVSCEGASEEEIVNMHLLANAVVLTSQGIPFLHAGVEMLRTKKGEHNSYNLPDSINQINWNWKTSHKDVFAYYQQLISLRRAHPAFSMPTAEMVYHHLEFVKTSPGLVGFLLKGNANNDSWKNILIYYNANKSAVRFTSRDEWQVAVKGKTINQAGIETVRNEVEVPPVSMLMLFQE